jgi:hypothetical protein
MTDLIISLGSAELFHPRWTSQIHDEWMRNLLADRPDLDPSKVERRRRQMDQAIDDCLMPDLTSLCLFKCETGLLVTGKDDTMCKTACNCS